MGAHTLGKADILNSGFHGMWVNNEQVLRDLLNQKKVWNFTVDKMKTAQYFRPLLTNQVGEVLIQIGLNWGSRPSMQLFSVAKQHAFQYLIPTRP